MIVSKCCKKKLFVVMDYYHCEHCHKPCDSIFSLSLTDDCYDSRNESAVETFAY